MDTLIPLVKAALAYLSTIGPVLTFVAALFAAGVAVFFGRTQARIARQQAATAAGAALTAKNKLRLDLFDRRMKIYDAVTAYMDEAATSADWRSDASPFFKDVSSARWLFDQSVVDWIQKELMDVVREVKTTQANLMSRSSGPDAYEASVACANAGRKLLAQYERRDDVFRPFMHLTD